MQAKKDNEDQFTLPGSEYRGSTSHGGSAEGPSLVEAVVYTRHYSAQFASAGTEEHVLRHGMALFFACGAQGRGQPPPRGSEPAPPPLLKMDSHSLSLAPSPSSVIPEPPPPPPPPPPLHFDSLRILPPSLPPSVALSLPDKKVC